MRCKIELFVKNSTYISQVSTDLGQQQRSLESYDSQYFDQSQMSQIEQQQQPFQDPHHQQQLLVQDPVRKN